MNNIGPQVRLINAFMSPLNNSVAAARSCYSSRIISPSEVAGDGKSKVKRDSIAQSTYLAGHHTVYQHPTFQFTIEGVSRLAIWSFLHNHPFYNSEQVSQRYVTVSPDNVYTPPNLTNVQQKIYQSAIQNLLNAYDTLLLLLSPSAHQELQRRFPGRNPNDAKFVSEVRKKAQEIARYVLPLATTAHLYHTISGVTLFRYCRLAKLYDVSDEQQALVRGMCEAVRSYDPDFIGLCEQSLDIHETPEFSFFQSEPPGADDSFDASHFDSILGGNISRLADFSVRSEGVLADSVRTLLGSTTLSDDEAIDLVMNSAKNQYLSETLNVTHHTKIPKAMAHPHFTFMKKLSHCADSQNQRHRTIPGSRPILSRHLSEGADFIVPELIKGSGSALEFYCSVMADLWESINRLIESGVDREVACYLLPNAVPIRFYESGSLLDFHHKWTTRLCYTAQEEIWLASKQEVEQVEHIFPRIGRYLRPPCHLRKNAGCTPFCPEGTRYCGVPVWKLNIDEMARKI